METKNVWEKYTEKQLEELEVLNKDYRHFLSKGKTERECVDQIVNMIEAAGYRDMDGYKGESPKAGDKLYRVNMNKTVVMFHLGKEELSAGMNILGAHIDSPRLDVKQNPLYEDGEIAYLDTHYYGGVKKYQWVTIPLALHGVVVKKDGTTIEVNIGEDKDDPVFFVSDLLIHLAQEQLEKKAAKVIEGEALDIIVGSKPIKIEADKDKKTSKKDAKSEDKNEASKKNNPKDPVKTGVIEILKKDYGFEEEDFLSAELEVVPAGRAREAGFDRSMILSYGQDDRVCAFTSLQAMLDIEDIPKKTACCLLVDKEEIGSVGATGMQSMYFENTMAELLDLMGQYSELSLRRALSNSCMLSSDVSAAFDPSFAGSFDKKNASYMGHGMVFNKFTGSRGKSGSNDANAEYIAYLRHIFEKEDITFQTAELGRVDLGGGGTIAYMTAKYGMNVIDAGVAVLNMHAPWECTSKADVYETKRGYTAFLKYCGEIEGK